MSMIFAGYLQQKIAISLFYIARVRCLCVYNNFKQYNLTPVTPATKAMAHVVYTSHILSYMPRACPQPTRILKYSDILQSNDTRHNVAAHKACTKAHASSMPVHK